MFYSGSRSRYIRRLLFLWIIGVKGGDLREENTLLFSCWVMGADTIKFVVSLIRRLRWIEHKLRPKFMRQEAFESYKDKRYDRDQDYVMGFRFLYLGVISRS